MKHRVYTIWDEVLCAYSSPILAINKGHMLRMLEIWNKNPNNELTANAKDKTLFEIGDYDDEKGRVEMHEANKNMGALHEFLDKEEETKLKGVI